VDDALTAVLGSRFLSASEPLRWWCRDRLIAWCEEIHSDLFATSLIGPAYSFASIELFSLLALLEEPDSLRFSKDHPAEAYRFNQQLQYLTETGWWSALAAYKTEHQALIETLANKSEEAYIYQVPENPQLGDCLIKAFLRMRATVRDLVTERCGRLAADKASFVAYGQDIEKYLLNAVVPSTLMIAGKACYPPETATVNASFLFSLALLDGLLRKIKNYRRNSVGDHAEVAGRIELWVLKAIEDHALLTKRQEAS
jgi:hypothetical protein